MLLALNELPGLGPVRVRELLKPFENPADVDVESVAAYQRKRKLPVRPPDLDSAERILDRTERIRAHLIAFHEPGYPKRLAEIYDAPLLLWYRGDPALFEQKAFAVVGTRRPSAYGMRQTRIYSNALARLGLVIVSGMAVGVDAVAHDAAIRAGGKTMAVLATGIDRLTPRVNRPLAHRILDSGGLLLSEMPPGTLGSEHMFPKRNRIVSGLSHGVLITDSAASGGSMNTATHAADQNRSIFTIPHPVDSGFGEGCNRLIRDSKAALTLSVQDIVLDLNLAFPHDAIPKDALDRLGQDLELTPEQRQLLAGLDEDAVGVDELSVRAGLTVSQVYHLVLELRLLGRVRQLGGGRVQKC